VTLLVRVGLIFAASFPDEQLHCSTRRLYQMHAPGLLWLCRLLAQRVMMMNDDAQCDQAPSLKLALSTLLATYPLQTGKSYIYTHTLSVHTYTHKESIKDSLSTHLHLHHTPRSCLLRSELTKLTLSTLYPLQPRVTYTHTHPLYTHPTSSPTPSSCLLRSKLQCCTTRLHI
jgi:hypothetical protein